MMQAHAPITEHCENAWKPNPLIVIPAKAGIHLPFDGRKMDPRFRGDDASFVEAVTRFGNAQ
jgi:hypothetical protein